MRGRRVPDGTSPHAYAPGDYGRWQGTWFCAAPSIGDLLGNLSQHTVVEHEDGSITVSPSILVRRRGAGEWHGFLERGVWRSC